MTNVGKIVQVIGPVVDIKFDSGNLPEIYNAVRIENKATGISVVCEVEQHLGENTVRAVSMTSTDGLVRGMDAVDLGKPITAPVGKSALGRILNVIGDPVDEKGPVEAIDYWPIHRAAPKLEDQDTGSNILETGIKVIDLLEPYTKGGKQVFLVVQELAKQFLLWSLLTTSQSSMEDILFSVVLVKGQEKEMTFILRCRNQEFLTRLPLCMGR